MKRKTRIRLGVNIDHVATLRQVRGGTTPYPDILAMAKLAAQGGAEQITVHLREDRRHIQVHDVKLLTKKCRLPINLEMAATTQMLQMALRFRPYYCCLVPEKRQELTTEGGLDVAKNVRSLAKIVEKLHAKKIFVSTFIDASAAQVKASFEVRADAIELHTGSWVEAKGKRRKAEWLRLVNAAKLAADLGMKVHAGHGLAFEHARQIRQLPFLEEVNIGHSLVCYALESGLKQSVQKMNRLLNS